MDQLNGTALIPGMKTGLWLRNFPYTLSEIFVINSTITVCHSLLYHTCCLTVQEQDGKVARVMTRVTVYNLPPNFNCVNIVFIVVSQVSFSPPHILHSWLAVSDHKWDQKFKSKIRSIVLLTHEKHWTLSIKHGDCFQNVVLQWNKIMGSVQCMCQFSSTS